MIVLTHTADGRCAVPAIASPILIAFIADPSAPSRATASATARAGRRRLDERATAAQASSGTPTNAGMSAVMLTADVRTYAPTPRMTSATPRAVVNRTIWTFY